MNIAGIIIGKGIQLDGCYIGKTKSGWVNTNSAAPGLQYCPSFIQAYSTGFAGYMTLRDMSHSFKRDHFTLLDCAKENWRATLKILQTRWIDAFRHVVGTKKLNSQVFRDDLRYLNEVIDTLSLFRRQMKRAEGGRGKVLIIGCLNEALAQFRNIKKDLIANNTNPHS